MEAPITLPQAGAPCTQAVLVASCASPTQTPTPRLCRLPSYPSPAITSLLKTSGGPRRIVHFLVFGNREDAASQVKELSLDLASRVPGSRSPLARLSWCCALWLGGPCSPHACRVVPPLPAVHLFEGHLLICLAGRQTRS